GQIPGPLAHRVIFTGFIADQDQLTALYPAVHILVHAAQHEPWGLIINEAVAAGLPLVSTDVVGAPVALVQHGENGLLVPCNDPGALAAAILEITEPERLAAARAKAPAALARWRAQADPIAGLRRALGLPPVP